MDLFAPFRSGRDGRPSVFGDLRDGVAPWWLRLLLTLAVAAGCVAVVLLVLGLVDQAAWRIDDEHIAVGLGLGGAAWCVMTIWIWAGHRRARRIVLATIAILGVWLVAIPLCVFIDSVFRREELLIASCIVAAIAATILIIGMAAHGATAGRHVVDEAGTVHVNCPQCGYSMVGLESSQCPECGALYTIDQLIRAQDYAAVRRLPALPSLIEPTPDGSAHDAARDAADTARGTAPPSVRPAEA